MIITRTPFRVSFFGGGTDYPDWYSQNGGIVVSTTINKYCYVVVRYLPPFFNHKYRIRYLRTENVNSITEIEHPSVRECLRYINPEIGIEMVHTSDIPARSGIGSSSAFTVGFLNALNALSGRLITKRELAADALKIEQEILQENVGSQDQVASAFGGLNKIEFGGPGNFVVTPIPVSRDKSEYLQSCLMLFFTGISRIANDIAAEQIRNTKNLYTELLEMSQLADHAVGAFSLAPEALIKEFGRLLDESWQIKRGLTKIITTHAIDEMYSRAIIAGALGGKLLGAGGGGFMLLIAEPPLHKKIKEALSGFLYVPFAFEELGSQVTLYSKQDFY